MRGLYQELIIDHGKKPRNRYRMEDYDYIMVGNNPLCGDRLVVYIKEVNVIIDAVSFEGEGCAISMASASLMTQALAGKTREQAQDIFDKFHAMLTKDEPIDEEFLGKLCALSGVKEYPVRVKCATLPWHALNAAFDQPNDEVSTE